MSLHLSLLLFGLCLLAFVALMGIVAKDTAHYPMTRRSLLSCVEQTTGIITQRTPRNKSKDVLWIRYEVKGKRYTIQEGILHSDEEYVVGKEVKVRYNPSAPHVSFFVE